MLNKPAPSDYSIGVPNKPIFGLLDAVFWSPNKFVGFVGDLLVG